jgi:hypothetical protein
MTDSSAVDDEIKANAQYWGVEGDEDYPASTDMEQAILDWYERLPHPVDIEQLDQEIEVVTYKDKQISQGFFKVHIEEMVENLDFCYGAEETCGDYYPSEEAMGLWKTFTDQIKKEYSVRQLDPIGSINVKWRDYIADEDI